MPLDPFYDAVCNVCRRTLPDLILRRRYKHDHHATLRALKTSSSQGCRTCAIFYHNFAYTDYQGSSLDEGPVAIVRSSKGDVFKIFLSGEHDEVTYGAEVPLHVKHTIQAAKELTSQDAQTRLSRAADSAENIAVLNKLLEDCNSNHPLCGVIGEGNDMPTRVLDVSLFQHNDAVRIVPETEVQGRNRRYVCLSHCRGLVPPDAPCMLIESRKQAYMTAIPMKLLPLTFQQAIELTCNMGERYLWIDALCIIQDSGADWAREASRMASIYTNSLVTLSAATSSSLEGCVLRREPSMAEPVLLNLDSNVSSGRMAHIFHGLPAENQLQQKVPVTKRAWCLQERKLTTRLIQFTPYQWTWTCRTAGTSERILRKLRITASTFDQRGQDGLHFHNQEDTSGSRVTRSDGTIDDEAVVKDYKASRKAYDDWYTTVQDFTKCDITYPTDRLPALAGLAQRQQSHVPDTYLAGLWEADILYGLAWGSNNPPEMCPATYIAPSWSWASINGAVSFEGFLHYQNQYSPKLISASISHSCEDELGMVTAGHLRWRGRLKPLSTSTVVLGFTKTFREFPTGHGVGIMRLDTHADAGLP
ncbi:HET-domain-containing protein [Setomelanomma holmii]|uniref:HET-domain-containing protein n=1 Tax=Setomelanomma holmii TaxID=210430 RepID=A0A9P4HF71_9PLEO|nr:HET-domain-containing protein [Setomelanomma holmii]